MRDWLTFPRGTWNSVGGILSGYGPGEGPYNMAYAIDKGSGPLLNGRISAQIRLSTDRRITGAGLIARADELRSFLAFYLVTHDTYPDMHSVRLAAFKQGKLISMVALKRPISIPDHKVHIALQFFSGEMLGEIVTAQESHKLEYILPELPFPGNCGVVRFYGSSVLAHGIHIEEINMKPILPEEDDKISQTYRFSVFLSHSSADKAIVLSVIKALKEAGITYWVDHEQITFGDGIVSKIEEGLQKSRNVVVCLSDNLRASGWCRGEYGPILYREFSGDTSRRVIPLSLDGSKNSDAVPLLLSDKMRADFTDERSFLSFLSFLRESK